MIGRVKGNTGINVTAVVFFVKLVKDYVLKSVYLYKEKEDLILIVNEGVNVKVKRTSV